MAYKKSKKGASIRRWLKEKWTDEKGNPCGSSKNKKVKACRPSRRVNSKSPKPWSEMSRGEKSKVVRAKKKAGMGRKRSSKSNVK